MVIGIDGNEANISHKVGINVYAYELLKSIYELNNKNLTDPIKFIVFLKENPNSDMPKATKNWEYKILKGTGFWIITRLSPYLILNSNKLDIFFSPTHYLPFAPFLPMVCSIMDLGYLNSSEQFKKKDFWQLKLWTAYSLYVSKSILTISETTRKDIVRHYKFTQNKVNVTLLGYDNKKFNELISQKDVRHIKTKYSIVNDYILFLSTLKPSKNVGRLIKAWGLIYKDFPKYCLVIAGKKGWLWDDIFTEVKKLGLEEKIVFTDFVDEDLKPALIAGARVFVMPSLWEGFGLDVLNAMACGVPVVISDRGSLPEITGGSAGVKVDPLDIQSIARGISKVLKMSEIEYNKMSKEGLKVAKEFSWEKTAKNTIEVLISSLKNYDKR